METQIKNPLKFLVIRLSSIGDIILTTPVLAAMKKAYPEAVIDFMVMDQFQEAIRGNRHLDRLILFNKQRYNGLSGLYRFCSGLSKTRYDFIIDLHAQMRSRLICRLLPGKVLRYRKRAWWKSIAVPLRLIRYQVDDTIVANYFGALKPLGVFYDSEPLHFDVSPADISRFEPYRGAVVLAPGAAYATKQWPPRHYAALGRRLAGDIVLVGGKADKGLCESIRGAIGARCKNLAGELSLKQSGALISLARFIVCNDSAAFHIARGVATPAFVIFGPTDPGMFNYDDRSVLLRHPIACAPCSLHGDNRCPKGHFDCMQALKPETVYAAITAGYVRRHPE